jgi:hypothetical protein
MCREAAELDRRHDSVAGRPRAVAAVHGRRIVGDDEALVVARQPVERGTEQTRHANTRRPGSRSPLGSSTRPPCSPRPTTPVRSSMPAVDSSSAMAALALGPNSDSGSCSGVTTITSRSSRPIERASPAVISASS